MYTENETNDMSEITVRIRAEEERIDNVLKDARRSHEELSGDYQYFLKQIDNRLSNENLTAEDMKFFEEQRDLIWNMQRKEEERFTEFDAMLQKEKRDLYEKESEEEGQNLS